MAEELNLDGVRTQMASKITDLEDEFLDSLDSRFLNNVLRWYDTSTGLGRTNDPINIVINELGTLRNDLTASLDFIDSLTLPERPHQLDEEVIRDVDHVFVEQRLDEMQAAFSQVYSSVTPNNGIGIAGTTRDAISDSNYNLDYDIEYNDVSIAVDDIAIRWSADGYEVAPGAMSFDIARVLDTFALGRDKKTRGFAVKLANVIEENVKAAFEHGINIERLHIAFSQSYTEFRYQKINAIIQAYLGEIQKVVKEITAPNDSIRAMLMAIKSDLKTTSGLKELELKQELTDLSAKVAAAGSASNANAKIAASQINLIENALSGYLALFNTYGNAFTGVAVQEQTVEKE